MAGAGRIGHIVVAGGGIVGWSAAAALKRRLSNVAVTIVPIAPTPDAFADRAIGTLPSILGFHQDLGIGDEDAVLRTGSAFRMGTLFAGWGGDGPDYVHAYGRHGQGVSFHQHWLRARAAGEADAFDAHALAAEMARAGRFLADAMAAAGPFGGYEYGLQIAPDRYRAMLRAFALHHGVVERQAASVRPLLRSEDGFIVALVPDGGEPIEADLFIDATGPRALLRSELDARREDWSRWFPCDQVLFAAATPAPSPPLYDRVEAQPAGWFWQGSSHAARSLGMVYSARHWSGASPEEELARRGATLIDTAPVLFEPGCRSEPWLRNCLAIGDAEVSIEPLEWTNLHLAHSAIDRMIASLPDSQCAPVELAHYNRQARDEMIRVRDFLLLHYAASGRGEPFWCEARAVDWPDSLARTLSLFRARGRLPFHEEETFVPDSWLSVLLGQGVLPARIDPLIEELPLAHSIRIVTAAHAAIRTILPRLPHHADTFGRTSRFSESIAQ
jgi:tryptophan halogenase